VGIFKLRLAFSHRRNSRVHKCNYDSLPQNGRENVLVCEHQQRQSGWHCHRWYRIAGVFERRGQIQLTNKQRILVSDFLSYKSLSHS
jgi:hypothetical protein